MLEVDEIMCSKYSHKTKETEIFTSPENFYGDLKKLQTHILELKNLSIKLCQYEWS